MDGEHESDDFDDDDDDDDDDDGDDDDYDEYVPGSKVVKRKYKEGK